MTDGTSDSKRSHIQGAAQARKSASLLKSRLLQAEQSEFASAVLSFAENPAFERAAAVIARSRRRFIIGRGNSKNYAATLASALQENFSQVTLVSSPSVEHIDLLSDVRPGDVLVAFCNRPYRRDTVEVSRLHVAAGGTLVLITDNADSPLSAFASEQIILDADEKLTQESSITVFLAVHLIAELTSASSKGAIRRKQERRRLGTLLNLYISDMRWVGRESELGTGAGPEQNYSPSR